MTDSVLKKEKPLGSYSVSIAKIKRIFEGLNKLLAEEANLELATWVKPQDKTDEEFQQQKDQVKSDAFRVTVSVYKADGSHTYDDRKEIFDVAPNEPLISTIYMTNTTAFKRAANGNDPTNYFHLRFDFTQPPLLDAQNIVSSPTANESILVVGGVRDGWLAGVESLVLNNIEKQHKIRRYFHGPFVYDFGLLIIGAPLSLYLCWLMSDFVAQYLTQKSVVLGAAGFVYVFFVGLWTYRTLFGYTKWAFPVAELIEQNGRPKSHRRWWWWLVVLILGKVFWDFFDPYLSIRNFFKS